MGEDNFSGFTNVNDKICLEFLVDRKGREKLTKYSTPGIISKMDLTLLKRRPLIARITNGAYKLKNDYVLSGFEEGHHFLVYKRMTDEEIKEVFETYGKMKD